MIRIMMLFLLLQLGMSATAAPPAASEGSAAGSAAEEPQTPKAQMDSLAQKALTEALKVVAESGGFYPFAMVLDRDNQARLIGISKKPAAGETTEDVAVSLFWQLRRFLQDNPGFVAAVIVKPHELKDKSGKMVPGLWATVDHRDLDPWVLFLPFIKEDNGTYSVAPEPSYLPATEPLFLDSLKAAEETE